MLWDMPQMVQRHQFSEVDEINNTLSATLRSRHVDHCVSLSVHAMHVSVASVCVWSTASANQHMLYMYLHDAVISLQQQLVAVFTCVHKHIAYVVR